MSQRVVRYEGEGRARRPVYDYEGPSAPSSSDGLAALGRLSAIDVRGVGERLAGSNAPIERRQITELERSIREEARPSPISPRAAAARPSPVQEEPIVTVSPPKPEATQEPASRQAVALASLAQAALDAAKAAEAKEAADVAWQIAEEALERAYQGVRLVGNPAVDPFLEPLRPVAPAPPRQAHTPAESRAAGTAGMLARKARDAATVAPKAGTNGSSPAGGGPGPMPPFLRRMLDALVASDGDRTAAAAKLGIKRTSLIGTLGKLRARDDLTEQERAAISSQAA